MDLKLKFSEDAQLDLRPDTPEHFQVAVAGGTVMAGATEAQAAQIEQNTAGIHMLSGMLESDINSQDMWESGQINSNGTNGANNARIRRKDRHNNTFRQANAENAERAFSP